MPFTKVTQSEDHSVVPSAEQQQIQDEIRRSGPGRLLSMLDESATTDQEDQQEPKQ
jgi:hypothetical protein